MRREVLYRFYSDNYVMRMQQIHHIGASETRLLAPVFGNRSSALKKGMSDWITETWTDNHASSCLSAVLIDVSMGSL